MTFAFHSFPAFFFKVVVFLVTLKPSCFYTISESPTENQIQVCGYTVPSNTRCWNKKKQSYLVEIKFIEQNENKGGQY